MGLCRHYGPDVARKIAAPARVGRIPVRGTRDGFRGAAEERARQARRSEGCAALFHWRVGKPQPAGGDAGDRRRLQPRLQHRIRLRGAARAESSPGHRRKLEGRGAPMGAVMMDFGAGLAGKAADIVQAVGGERHGVGETCEGGEARTMAADKSGMEQSKRVLQRLKTELGDDIFTSWFTGTEVEEADGATVILSVPTPFLKSWIMSHYRDRLLAIWQEARPW